MTAIYRAMQTGAAKATAVLGCALAASVGCSNGAVDGVGPTAAAGGSGGAAAACPAGIELCGAECTATQLDPGNCGSCGKACDKGYVCSGGVCQFDCLGGTTKCGTSCVDTSLDRDHCGGCDQACGTGQVCSAGECGVDCLGGTTKCGSLCVNTASDPQNGAQDIEIYLREK
ncbi:MAG: hypothetical protein HY744_21285 [Deltaproteobacteria bacterium]|nr:hypothetical protein [Deltaproteobacteria bacterium]